MPRPYRLPFEKEITEMEDVLARLEAGSAGQGFTVDVATPAGTFTSADTGCGPFSAAAASGQNITVTVSTPFSLLTPLVRSVTGNPTIRSSVTVRVQ